MAKNTRFEENPRFFETVLRKPGVERLVDDIGDAALANAQASAPVDTQAYRNGLHIEHHDSRYRRTTRVVGSDDKTMLIESTTGNLARALKGAKR
ncbi:HK97 gp10 family phage protein [Microbacterium sp. K24]|uniref:HK97 gp10 family phage protein n=1 Tax=Microbacterium sp. K24 TaxID=2305446 RepID=UPI00109C5F2B|nr:HK97 gp10 family phage protein [Microbacterium sp. K24]